MTRVVSGIYDDVELATGIFLSDNEVDIVIDWLDSYADALEKSWVKKGSEGDPLKQKFAKVRSFKKAVFCKRGINSDVGQNNPEQEGQTK